MLFVDVIRFCIFLDKIYDVTLFVICDWTFGNIFESFFQFVAKMIIVYENPQALNVYDVKLVFLEKLPRPFTRPTRFFGIVTDDCIKNDRNSTVLDEMLMLLASEIFSNQGHSGHFFLYFHGYFESQLLKFLEPCLSHFNCKSVSITLGSTAVSFCLFTIIGEKRHVFGANYPSLSFS